MHTKNKRLTIFLITALVFVLMLSVVSYAWYTLSDDHNGNISQQAYDSYVFNLTDVIVSPELQVTQTLNNKQASGETALIYSGSTPTSYNSATDKIAYVLARVNYNAGNITASKEMKLIVTDVEVGDGASGTVSDNLKNRIKSDLILQFINTPDENSEGKINYISSTNTDTKFPLIGSWKTFATEESSCPSTIITLENAGENSCYLAVAFNLTDDTFDPEYIGKVLSFTVKAVAVDA